MATNTVVCVFETYPEAERAAAELASVGVDRDSIHITANDSAAALATEGSTSVERGSSHAESEGLGDRIGNFFRSLFGSHDNRDDADSYAEAVRRGSAVVTVNADSAEEADRAADILGRRGAVDVDARAQEWKQSGWAGSPQSTGSVRSPDAAQDREAVIPVVREELQVGKRRRERGGVRIYTHMEAAAVEENVRLRDERAVVERRPADRPATQADFAAFKEGTIEVRETVEEPVVAKTARVVEEVVVGKETSERTETVSDSVRRGEVDVQPLEGTRSQKGTREGTRADTLDDLDSDYQNHWRTNYANADDAYETYEPAYNYGSSLARDDRYRERQWNEIEPDARREWETRNPGSAWDRFKAAVRHGWEKVTGHR